MPIPLGLEQLGDRNPVSIGPALYAQAPQVLSIDAQLKLRELYQYVESGRSALDEIRRDLALFESDPGEFANLQKVSERLKEFCLEADSWGFNALYQVGMGLQVLLVNSSHRVVEHAFRDTLDRGLGMLSALLDQCESEFRWRLAVGDTLDSIDQLFRN